MYNIINIVHWQTDSKGAKTGREKRKIIVKGQEETNPPEHTYIVLHDNIIISISTNFRIGSKLSLDAIYNPVWN